MVNAIRSCLPRRGGDARWLLIQLRRFPTRRGRGRRILILRKRPVFAEHFVERIVPTRALLRQVQVSRRGALAARVVGDVGEQEWGAGLLVLAGGEIAQVLGKEREPVLAEHPA